MSEAALTVTKADSFQVPAIVAEVGPEAAKRFFEFFTVPIRNKNTRIAYYHAIGEFLDWCQRAGFRHLEDIEPIHVAAYIESHSGSAATIKQHMAAIRMLFSWLTEKGILAMNPAREVKTPRFSRSEGKTPAPPHEEVQNLLDSIDVSHLIGLRDRALLGVMAYTFARIGAVVSLRPQDYFQIGKRSVIRFREKGGKEKEIPVHHELEEYLDAYLSAAKLSEEPGNPLFRSTRGRSRELGADGLSRKDAWAMLKRRLRNAGLQRIAGHVDSRTTKLYDRRGQKVLLEDMERIRY